MASPSGEEHNWLSTRLGVSKADGTARRHAARRNGIALEAARRAKERKYPELAGRGGRARLVVVGAEVGGRFSSETSQFLRGLMSAKVRGVPPPLKGKAVAAWMRRWSSMLGCVAWSPTLLHCPSLVEFPLELTVSSLPV